MRSLLSCPFFLITGIHGDWIRELSSIEATVEKKEYPESLSVSSNSDAYHMTPVRAIHARAQSDDPIWDSTYNMFTSKYGSSFETRFRAGLDTINTASVEGALMYVQAETINYDMRGQTEMCTRKNNVKYIAFYDIIFTQSNHTLAEFEGEYGPMVPMDSGQCTPANGTSQFHENCLFFNGTEKTKNIGPYVGAGLKESDVRAPYPNTYWFSFPHTCPLSPWSKKTDVCRNSTQRGLCPYNMMPDGIHCIFNYRILGYVAIDDVVGITSMSNANTGHLYTNFSEFCKDGNVEFKASTTTGSFISGIDFWKQPQNTSANADRTRRLVMAYRDLLHSGQSPQVNASIVNHMKPLPSIQNLTSENPPCYKNVKRCASGCFRALFGQLCYPCVEGSADCVAAPNGYVLPTLAKATVGSDSTVSYPPQGTQAETKSTTVPASSGAGCRQSPSFVNVLLVCAAGLLAASVI